MSDFQISESVAEVFATNPPKVISTPTEINSVQTSEPNSGPTLEIELVDVSGFTPPAIKKKEIATVGLKATLLSNAVKVELAPGLFRLISYSDFLDSLKKHLDEKDGSSKSMKEIQLPTGAFYISISDKEIKISSYYPECQKVVRYKTGSYHVVVPNIIVSLIIIMVRPNEYKVSDARYFCTKEPLSSIPKAFTTSASGMNLLPFTNCYTDHRLCYGSAFKVSDYKLPDLRGAYSYYQVLFDSVFNDDLGLSGVKTPWSRQEYVKWYKHLESLAKDNKPFPYDQLVRY